MSKRPLINTTQEWHTLEALASELTPQSIQELFLTDPARAQNYQLSIANIMLDYSKNLVTDSVLKNLIKLAETQHLKESIQQLFHGEKINFTENRSVQHMALREATAEPIKKAFKQMEIFVDAIHQKTWRGYTNKSITDIVNIGIGGSDLGPRLVVNALKPYHTGHVKIHFVSNIDGADIATVLHPLNPETTLFIIASKTFTTLETLMNARTARQWLVNHAHDEKVIKKHFVAVTAKPDRAKEFGIAAENIFAFWDWVGGRYSLWSTIGLPIALAIGMDNFNALLKGAHQMDLHFKNAPLAENLPVMLALMGIWYRNFLNYPTYAVIPYDERLKLFPAYLQQLDMESNGKSTNFLGETISYKTSPVIWGDVGTNGQHAFHQWLHQGTDIVPVDFIVCKKSDYDLPEHHAWLYANCLAQSQALMCGRTEQEAYEECLSQGMDETEARKIAPHKVIVGNKSHNLLLLDRLCPQTLGSLLALYEHKIFVQGIVWQINSFDQYGVELGKTIASSIHEKLSNPDTSKTFDPSTEHLIKYF